MVSFPPRFVLGAGFLEPSQKSLVFSPPPLPLPGEQIQILASQRGMFLNGLSLFVLQNHPEVLTYRIHRESEELIVTLERNE